MQRYSHYNYSHLLTEFNHHPDDSNADENYWFTAQLHEFSEEEAKHFSSLPADEINEEKSKIYSNQLLVMQGQMSEFCYAAYNGYTEFFHVFQSLPEKERAEVMEKRNGDLAFLYAMQNDHVEIAEILLKQKYIQNLINSPCNIKRLTQNENMPEGVIEGSVDSKLMVEFKEVFPLPKHLEEKALPYTYGQLGLMLSLRSNNTMKAFSLLSAFLLDEQPSDNKADSKTVNNPHNQQEVDAAIISRLNEITKNVLVNTTRWLKNNKVDTSAGDIKPVIIYCKHSLKAQYIKHFLERRIGKDTLQIHKNTNMYSLGWVNPTIEMINQCSVIPAIFDLQFCTKKLERHNWSKNAVISRLPLRDIPMYVDGCSVAIYLNDKKFDRSAPMAFVKKSNLQLSQQDVASMNSYTDLLNKFQCDSNNFWFTKQLQGLSDKQLTELGNVASDYPEELEGEYKRFYNNQLIVMDSEMSELCYAAYNGYTEFFKVFQHLPEKEQAKVMEEKNGDLAFLYAAQNGHTEIVAILLKTKHVQNILNSPCEFKRIKLIKESVKSTIQSQLLDDFRKVFMPPKHLQNQTIPYTYGQLALLLSLTRRNKSHTFSLLSSLLQETQVADNKADGKATTRADKQQKKDTAIIRRLNEITSNALVGGVKWRKADKIGKLAGNVKSVVLYCEYYFQSQYIEYFLNKQAGSGKLQVNTNADIGLRFQNKYGSHDERFLMSLIDPTLEVLNNYSAIPSIFDLKFEFCDKKLNESIVSQNLNLRSLSSAAVRSNPPYLTSYLCAMEKRVTNHKTTYHLAILSLEEMNSLDKRNIIDYSPCMLFVKDSSLRFSCQMSFIPEDHMNDLQAMNENRGNRFNSIIKNKFNGELCRQHAMSLAMGIAGAIPAAVVRKKELENIELQEKRREAQDMLCSLPDKFSNALSKNRAKMQESKREMEQDAKLISTLLAKLEKTNSGKNKGNKKPNKQESANNKENQARNFVLEADEIIKLLNDIESQFDKIYDENHLQVMQLCDNNELSQAYAIIRSIQEPLEALEGPVRKLQDVKSGIEKLKCELLKKFSRLEEHQFKVRQEEEAKKQAAIEQEKARVIKEKAADAKIEDERWKTYIENLKKQEKRERWLEQQAKYEEQKALKQALSTKQQENCNSEFANLYGRPAKNERIRFFDSKAPAQLDLNAVGGFVDLRFKLTEELDNVKKLLTTLSDSKDSKEPGEQRLGFECCAIRGGLARVFEIIRHFKNKILPKDEAYALRIYLFKGPFFQSGRKNDLIALSLELLEYCRKLGRTAWLRHVPFTVTPKYQFGCLSYMSLLRDAVDYAKVTKHSREVAPELNSLLKEIQVDRTSLNALASMSGDSLFPLAESYYYARLGHHCALLRKHYSADFNKSSDKTAYETYIDRGNAIRHNDCTVTINTNETAVSRAAVA